MGTEISGSSGIDKIQNNAVDIADLSATGTASASTFLRGDNAWTDALPTQSGNAGKFLTTDASTASWTEAGKVLQVVNATDATFISTTTNTFADTSLTATITPTSTSSTILILITQAWRKDVTDTSLMLRLLRGVTLVGGSNIFERPGNTGGGDTQTGVVAYNVIDSPATTSAITYKTQYASQNNASLVYVNFGDRSSMTLMEIAG